MSLLSEDRHPGGARVDTVGPEPEQGLGPAHNQLAESSSAAMFRKRLFFGTISVIFLFLPCLVWKLNILFLFIQ